MVYRRSSVPYKTLLLLGALAISIAESTDLQGTDLAPGRDIVISEISYNPPSGLGSDASFEFVEAHNRGETAVDVSGWLLRDGDETEPFIIPGDTTIEPGGYLVLARDATSMRGVFGSALPVIGDFAFELANGGDVVFLYDQDGQLVDRVEYKDDAPWPAEADGDGSTLERISLSDDMTDFTNFAASVAAARPGTPGLVNSQDGEIPSRHNIVINEIMYNPVIDPDEQNLRHCDADEFLEIHNRGSEAVDLGFWKLSEGVRYAFPAGTTIAAGGYLVLYPDESAFREKYGDVAGAVGPYSGRLSNGGEDILLVDSSNRPVDVVDYNDSTPWPVNPDGLRGSLELVDASGDNDRGQAWRESEDFEGTPGAINSATTAFMAAAGNVGPQITSVVAAPAEERPIDGPSLGNVLSTDSVRVEARVADHDGVSEVSLEYQAMAPGEYIRKADPAFETSWTPVEMHFEASTGKYVAEISAFPHRTLVRYRIAATDAASTPAQAFAPFARDPEPNFAYFVYDGVPDYVASQRSAFGEPGYTHTNLTKVPVYFILGHPDDIHEIQNVPIPESLFSLYRHRLTFVHEGRVHDHVGARLRGSITSRFTNPKRSWKIKFNKGNRFRGRFDDGTPFPSARGKANIVRASNNGIVESLALRIYRESGSIASTTSFVHLRVVDDPDEHNQLTGDFYGLYLDLQDIDSGLLDDLGRPSDDAATIYKFRGFADKRHPDCDPLDTTDIDEFMATALAIDPDLDAVRESLDVVRHTAFHVATDLTNNGDMDGKNFFYCFNPDTGKWEPAPWDIDGAFRDTSGDEPLRRILRHFPIEHGNNFRAIWQLVYSDERLRRILDEWLDRNKELAAANQDRWGSGPIESSIDFVYNATLELRDEFVPELLDANAPYTPVNAGPQPESTPGLPVTLQGSPFWDPDSEDTHAATRWLLIEEGGDWVYPIWESETGQNLDEIGLPRDLIESGKRYLFRMAHRDSTGRWGFFSEPTAFGFGSSSAKPDSPTGLHAVHVGFRSVQLEWDLAADLGDEILGYHVLRDGQPFTRNLLSDAVFVDATPESGSRHRYEIIAVNRANIESLPSQHVEVDVPTGDLLGDWQRPAGGLDYLYDANLGEEVYMDARLHPAARMLDGSWSSSTANAWDGSQPGEGTPGGAVTTFVAGAAEDGGPATVLSLEDPPTPSEAINSRLLFLRDMGTGTLIDDGVTVFARLRVNPEPIDLPGVKSQNPGSQLRGQIGVGHRASRSRWHFSVWLEDGFLKTATGQSIAVSMIEFQSIWFTLQAEEGGHRLRLFLNGETTPEIDAVVTLSRSGTERDAGENYLEMGLANSEDSGAIEIDYIGFKRGLHVPLGGAEPTFIRGDVNGDAEVKLDDAVAVLNSLFSGAAAPTCLDAADANDSGSLNVTDAIVLIRSLFAGGSPPAAPFPDCGADATEDGLAPCTGGACG